MRVLCACCARVCAFVWWLVVLLLSLSLSYVALLAPQLLGAERVSLFEVEAGSDEAVLTVSEVGARRGWGRVRCALVWACSCSVRVLAQARAWARGVGWCLPALQRACSCVNTSACARSRGARAQDARGVRVKTNQGIVGTVFQSRASINILDAQSDPRFNRAADAKTGFITRTLAAVPVTDAHGEVVGVLQAINKVTGGTFTVGDLEMLQAVGEAVALPMRKEQLLLEAEAARKQSFALIDVVKVSNDTETDVETLMERLVAVAYRVIPAERVTLFLLDELSNELWCRVSQDAQGIRVPLGKGIAGSVAVSGDAVNIPDAYSDSRFDQSVDRRTGFKTRSILCMPVKDEEENVVGVIQAINKKTGKAFNDQDEALLSAFTSEVRGAAVVAGIACVCLCVAVSVPVLVCLCLCVHARTHPCKPLAHVMRRSAPSSSAGACRSRTTRCSPTGAPRTA